MTIICSRCGRTVESDTKRGYLCASCRAAIKAGSTVRPRVCRNCGITFDGGPRAMYCPDCRAARQRMQSAAHKRSGAARPIGSTDTCTMCGAEYTVESGRQMYCKDCAPEAVQESVSRAKAEMAAEQPEKIDAAREGRKSRMIPCAACGQPFHPTTPTPYCSDLCTRYGKYLSMARADIKRGQRKSSPLSFEDWSAKNVHHH